VKYYQIDLASKSPSSKYLSFQISFVSKPNIPNLLPFFIEQTNALPEVDYRGIIADNTTSDMNGSLIYYLDHINQIGYWNQKSYYYIVIEIDTLSSSNSL
jgi:hypothetical protein